METKQFNQIVVKCADELSVGNPKIVSYLNNGKALFAIQCDNPTRIIAELILMVTSECEQRLYMNDQWWLETEQHIANLCETLEVKQICNKNVMYFPTIPCVLLPTI